MKLRIYYGYMTITILYADDLVVIAKTEDDYKSNNSVENRCMRVNDNNKSYGTMRHVRSGKNTRCIFFPLAPKVREIGIQKGLHESEQIWL